ncbi:MAG TPA: hypothetical protein VFZ97_00830 [Acidimicrobiales bacterium]
MYQWSRTARLVVGHPRDGMDWAVRITEKVNQISSVRSTLWASFASPDAGMCAWSLMVEEPAELEEINSKLSVDNGFLTLAAESANYVADGTMQDRLATIVYATPGAAGGDFHWASVTTATVTPGNVRRGTELGVQFAQLANQISGREAMFQTGITGEFGSVTWVLLADSFGQLQESEAKINSDPSFLELIDNEASKAYQPMGAMVSCYRRIA